MQYFDSSMTRKADLNCVDEMLLPRDLFPVFLGITKRHVYRLNHRQGQRFL